ncbi:MAG: hypothetical protein ACREA9_09985 [Pyrinomonadaceae bacterium]
MEPTQYAVTLDRCMKASVELVTDRLTKAAACISTNASSEAIVLD